MGLYCDGCGLPGGSRQGLNSPRWRCLGGVSKGDAVRGDMAARGSPAPMQFLLNLLSMTQRRGPGTGRGEASQNMLRKPMSSPATQGGGCSGATREPHRPPRQGSRGMDGGNALVSPQSIAPRCSCRGWRLRWCCGLLRTGWLLLELQRSPRVSGVLLLGQREQQTANSRPGAQGGERGAAAAAKPLRRRRRSSSPNACPAPVKGFELCPAPKRCELL